MHVRGERGRELARELVLDDLDGAAERRRLVARDAVEDSAVDDRLVASMTPGLSRR